MRICHANVSVDPPTRAGLQITTGGQLQQSATQVEASGASHATTGAATSVPVYVTAYATVDRDNRGGGGVPAWSGSACVQHGVRELVDDARVAVAHGSGGDPSVGG